MIINRINRPYIYVGAMTLSRHIGCQDTAPLVKEKVEDPLQFLEFSFTSLLSLI